MATFSHGSRRLARAPRHTGEGRFRLRVHGRPSNSIHLAPTTSAARRVFDREAQAAAPRSGNPGDHRQLAIPVLIPNTVVKQLPPMILHARESRSSPGSFAPAAPRAAGVFFLFDISRVVSALRPQRRAAPRSSVSRAREGPIMRMGPLAVRGPVPSQSSTRVRGIPRGSELRRRGASEACPLPSRSSRREGAARTIGVRAMRAQLSKRFTQRDRPYSVVGCGTELPTCASKGELRTRQAQASRAGALQNLRTTPITTPRTSTSGTCSGWSVGWEGWRRQPSGSR